MFKWIKNALNRRQMTKDIGLSAKRFIHVSVDLMVVPKFKWDIIRNKELGVDEMVKVQDGWAFQVVPKDRHVTYVRPDPKPRSARRRRIEQRGVRNNWGAEWYVGQRMRAVATQVQQQAAKERENANRTG